MTTDGVSTTVNGAVPGLEIKEGGLGSRAQSVALATLCLVLFLTFLDNTVVSVGLADVQSSLHAGITSLQWVVNGYALTFAAFMLAGGTLGDILGRKKVMLAGVAVFCAGSVVAAMAPNVDVLIGGRVDHGPRGGRLGARDPLHHPPRLPRRAHPGRRPGRMGGRLRPRPRPRPGHRRRAGRALELARHLLVQPALRCRGLPHGAALRARDLGSRGPGGSTGSASSWARSPWPPPPSPSSKGSSRATSRGGSTCASRPSVVFGAAFFFVEHRVRRPILDFSLFRKAPFSGSVFVAFAAYFGTFSIFFFTALYLQVVVNASAYQTAVTFLPMAAGLIVASIVTGPWVARQGPRIPMTVGCVLAAVGITLTSHLLGPHVDLPTLGWALAIAGVGLRHHAGAGHLHAPRPWCAPSTRAWRRRSPTPAGRWAPSSGWPCWAPS